MHGTIERICVNDAAHAAPDIDEVIERIRSALDRNTSAIVAASGIGGLLMMPFVVGQLLDRVGPQSLPPTELALALLTAAVAAFGGRLLMSGQRPPVTSMNAPVT